MVRSRTGKVLSTMGDSAPDHNVVLSPDERQVAVGLGLGAGSLENLDIWVFDIARAVRSRLTANPEVDQSPIWSPDGARIVYGVLHGDKVTLRVSSTAGAALGETLLEVTGISSWPCDSVRRCSLAPTSWSPDGRYIAYTLAGAFPSNLWTSGCCRCLGIASPIPVLETEFAESAAVFSPDGRWIAYTSTESGGLNVVRATVSWEAAGRSGFPPMAQPARLARRWPRVVRSRATARSPALRSSHHRVCRGASAGPLY